MPESTTPSAAAARRGPGRPRKEEPDGAAPAEEEAAGRPVSAERRKLAAEIAELEAKGGKATGSERALLQALKNLHRLELIREERAQRAARLRAVVTQEHRRGQIAHDARLGEALRTTLGLSAEELIERVKSGRITLAG